MTRSMTAYGRSEHTDPLGLFIWELRSVNHRYLDLSLRLPEELRQMESELRRRIGGQIHRGKCEISLRFQASATDEASLQINTALADKVAAQADALCQRHAHLSPMSVAELLGWPGVVSSASQDMSLVQARALAQFDRALADFCASREREGHQLGALILQRCAAIEQTAGHLRQLRPQVVQRQKERLATRIAEMQLELEPGRLEQELALQATRLDVDEELDRLLNHVQEVRQALQRSGAIGRRLDFLMQELNREANTLSAKSADSETTSLTVELKVLIEQMREQVQNIE